MEAPYDLDVDTVSDLSLDWVMIICRAHKGQSGTNTVNGVRIFLVDLGNDAVS